MLVRGISVRAALACIGVFAAMLIGVTSASAGGVINLCIGSKAGQGVKSGGEGTGKCPAPTSTVTYKKVALPLEESEQQTLLSILSHAKYVASGIGGKPTIQFSGVNVQVVNGEGKTRNENGAGNLIIGYDENLRGKCSTGEGINTRQECEELHGTWTPEPHPQTGSHDLVLGVEQEYTSVGGIVAGVENAVTGEWASVTGGVNNTASGFVSSVTGGFLNRASAQQSSVTGGAENLASEFNATVSGGGGNIASGDGSAISGGVGNKASGFTAAISGGKENTAFGPNASVSGGFKNLASGVEAWIGAGKENTAGGTFSSVSGGFKNKASGEVSSIDGGGGNEASGIFGWVGGGANNKASGTGSSVSAGEENTASGKKASVSGGKLNLAEGNWSSILGGFKLTNTTEFGTTN